MMKKNMIWDLFFTFMKIGLFTFGGGYAMISIIEDCCAEKKSWITHEEMMDITVIAESTPGPIAINCATYIGCKQAGFTGSLAATAGIVAPSFLIIFWISRFLDNFLEIPLIYRAFRGIKIGVGLLILGAALTMIKKMRKKELPIVIMVSSFVLMFLINLFSWNFSSISLMTTAGLVSLAVFLLGGGSKKKGGAL